MVVISGWVILYKPGSSHHLYLQAYLVAEGAFMTNSKYHGIISRYFEINVFNACSLGLVYKEYE